MAAASRDLLTPDALSMLLAIEETGSFAAAARQRGLVPSALTYRVRQIEDALDVLLFDRYAGDKLPEGKVSLALQVTLQPREATLTDAQIEAVAEKIVAAVAKATGAVLRA